MRAAHPLYSAKAPARWLYNSAPCPASSSATKPSGSMCSATMLASAVATCVAVAWVVAPASISRAHQRHGGEGRDVIHGIPRHRAGAQYIVCQRRLAQVGKVEAHQRAAEVFHFLAREIEDFLFIHMDDLRGVLQAHCAVIAGQVQPSLAVHIGANAARGPPPGPLHRPRTARGRPHRKPSAPAVPTRWPAPGRTASGTAPLPRRVQMLSVSYSSPPFRNGLPFRRSAHGHGSVFSRFSPAKFYQNFFIWRSLAF